MIFLFHIETVWIWCYNEYSSKAGLPAKVARSGNKISGKVDFYR